MGRLERSTLSSDVLNSYKKFQQAFGVNILEASKTNLSRLVNQLSEASHSEPLAPPEQALYQFVLKHLTLKHKTAYLAAIRESGYLLSLDERERRNIDTDNSHTARQHHETDNVFFTLGLGNHPSPQFLEKAEHVITIPLLTMLQDEPAALAGLWTCPHLIDFVLFNRSNEFELSGTRFYMKHYPNFSKSYHYKYPDGHSKVVTVLRNEEIFAGEDVCPSVAYQFIQHLRNVGGKYQDSILKTVVSDLSEEKKLKILSAAMTVLMPGWMTLEAKIPAKLTINKSYIRFDCENQNEQVKGQMRTWICSGDKVALEKKLKMGFSINQPLHSNFFSKIYEDPLYISLESRNDNLFDFLLTTYSTHPEDSEIREYANFHRVGLIKQICYWGDVPKMKRLLAAGLDVTPFGHAYLLLAAKNKHNNMFHLLLDNGARPDKPLDGWLLLNELMSNDMFEEICRVIDMGIVDPRIASRGGHLFLEDNDIYQIKQEVIDVPAGINLLHLAVTRGQFLQVEALINKGVNVSARTEAGDTPYSIAEAEIKQLEKELLDIQENRGENLQKIRAKVKNNAVSFQQIFQKKIRLNISYEEWESSFHSHAESLRAKIREFRQIQAVLKKHGANTRLNKTFMEQCTTHRYIAIGIVTGLNQKNQPSVVLGRKRLEKNAMDSEYIFPGGFKDIHDETFLDAAAREVEEETGLPISLLIKQKKVKHQLLYNFEISGADNKVHYHIELYHFDLNDCLQNYQLYAYDDLAVVKLIPIEQIVQAEQAPISELFRVVDEKESLKLRTSNGLALELLKGMNVQEKLHEVMQIENDAHNMMCYAAKTGALVELERLCSHGYLPKKSQIDGSSPLKSACDNQQLNVLQILISIGADLGAEDVDLLRIPVKQNNIGMVHYLLMQPGLRAGLFQMALVYTQHAEMTKLLLNYLLETLKKYPKPSNYPARYDISEATPWAFVCATEFGLKAIAEALLAHWSWKLPLLPNEQKKLYKKLQANGWQEITIEIAKRQLFSKLFNSYRYQNQLPALTLSPGNDEHYLRIEMENKPLPAEVKINRWFLTCQQGSVFKIDQSVIKNAIGDEKMAAIIFNVLKLSVAAHTEQKHSANVGLTVGTSLFFHARNISSRAQEESCAVVKR